MAVGSVGLCSRAGASRICCIFVLFFFTFWYVTLMSTQVSQFVSYKKPQPKCCSRTVENEESPNEDAHIEPNISHVIASLGGNKRLNESMTGELWDFKNTAHLRLYLYENVLKKNWTRNHDNLIKLRKEMANYRSELDGGAMLILHQANTKVGQRVKYIFGDASKQVTRDLFKQLPKNDPIPEKIKSCAVIGNSGVLRNSKCGSAIDGHDFIFRCNLAPLQQFGDDAGRKSNLTTMNPSIIPIRYKSLRKAADLKRYSGDLHGYSGLMWMPCFAFSHWWSTCARTMKAYRGKELKFVCGHPSHQKYLSAFWAERSLEQRLSTGMYLVMTAIQLCDEVHLYGFWPFSTRYDGNRTEVPYHYFDDMSFDPKDSKGAHDMNSEFNILLQLHVKGIVRIHVGSC